MFTDKAQTIIDLAKDFAQSTGAKELNVSSLALAMLHHVEGAILLAECAGTTPENSRPPCLPEASHPLAGANCPWRSQSGLCCRPQRNWPRKCLTGRIRGWWICGIWPAPSQCPGRCAPC